MDLKAYEHLIRSESAARKYMLGFCWKTHQRFCPVCRQRKLYKLTDSRRRCSRCGYTFHDFSGRWLNLVDLSCGHWLRLIKLFDRHLKIDHGNKVYASGNAYINGLEGFRSFAKERLIKHHGVSRTWFPFYLKGLELRYNNRRNDIFRALCQYVCDFIPLVPDRE